MQAISRVPHAIIDDVTYNFGVTLLSEKQQFTIFNNIAKKKEYDNTRHEATHRMFEYNDKRQGIIYSRIDEFRKGRHFGYCMSVRCKNTHDPRHAAPFGTNVGYHCMECLSKLILEWREKSLGSIIRIRFFSENATEEISDDIVVIKFDVDSVFIHDATGSYPFKWIDTENGPIIELTAPCVINGKQKTGMCFGQIKGRQVCENLILGKTCQSFVNTNKLSNFQINSVLPGATGWTENHNLGKEGQIQIHRFCPKCAYQIEQQKTNWSAKPKKINEIELRSNGESEFWKNKYMQLREDFNKLQLEKLNLDAQLINMQFSRKDKDKK